MPVGQMTICYEQCKNNLTWSLVGFNNNSEMYEPVGYNNNTNNNMSLLATTITQIIIRAYWLQQYSQT